MRALTAAQMREADARAAARVGEVALMQHAGAKIATALERLVPSPRRVVAFAGPGNNGGDAFAVLALLDPPCERIVFALPAPHPTEARADAEQRAKRAGVVTMPFPEDAAAAQAALDGASVILDGMLGTGARPDTTQFAAAIDALNAHAVPRIAIDLPTGVDATTGAVAEHAVRADATITLGALKVGLLLDPARTCTGALWLADIGIERDEIDGVPGESFAALDDAEFLALLPARAPESDKRRSGAPLILAGSVQFPGAAVLASRGAARAGAGYVTVATTTAAAPALRTHLVEQVVMTYDHGDPAEAIDELAGLMNHSSAAGIGPGLGLDNATGKIVHGFIARLSTPFVVDASGLFHLAKHLDVLHGKHCVVTPHEGEFARLSGEGTVAPGTRVARLRSFVARTGITTLLKGNATLIDDGTTIHVNVTGTNALATAGTGDVLTGITATLLSQGLSPVDAARTAAYWHGLAGQEAARLRPIGVIAGDVAESLGAAFAAARDRVAQHRSDGLTRIY